MDVFLSFSALIYLFFQFFKMHKKWYKNGLCDENGHFEKNHTKCSRLIFLCSILSPRALYVSPQKTFCTLYPLFVACGFYGSITKNTKNVLFLGRAFPMTVSESPSSSEFALFCTLESYVVFVFRFFFVFSFSFCTTVQSVRSAQREDIQIIREIINDKSIRHREVYSEWNPGKMVPGKMVPEKNGPRKKGPRENVPRKIGPRKNGFRENGPEKLVVAKLRNKKSWGERRASWCVCVECWDLINL